MLIINAIYIVFFLNESHFRIFNMDKHVPKLVDQTETN